MINRNEIVDKLIDEHDCRYSEEFADFLIEKIEKEFLFQELCTYFYLKNEVKNCEPYDGYTKEEQLEYYINKCGFNPIEKLNIQKEKIINILSNHVTLEEIGEFQGDFNNIYSTNRIGLHENLKIHFENIKMKLNSFENKELILSFILEIYFKNI